jgi:hypothetical protein
MIIVKGNGSNLKEIRVRRDGRVIILTSDTEPKVLFEVLRELAVFITRNNK